MASYSQLAAADRVERFSATPAFRDPLFAVLFMLHAVAFVALLVAGAVWGVPQTLDDGSGFFWLSSLQPQERVIFSTLAAICFALGAVLGSAMLALLRLHPVSMIFASLCLGCVMSVAMAILAFVNMQPIVGAVLTVMALLNLVFVWFVRERVPLTAALLNTASQVTKMYPAQIVMALLSLAAHLVYLVAWSFALTLTQQVDALRGPWPFLFLLFSFFWTHQVMQNLLHTVCCGVFASWYFYDTHIMPANPTVASFKRATTYSFGSVAFGSLVVAVVQMTRALFSLLRLTDHDIIVCLVDCFLSMLDRLVEYFNTYAFSYVAIYGLAFTKAAQRVWRLLLDRGWTAVINDSLTSGVMVWGAVSSGVVVGLVVALVAASMSFVDPSAYSFMLPLIGFFGFAIGYSVVRVMLQPIESGVITLFVCCAEAPATLQNRRPDLYEMLRERYPNLMTGIVEPIAQAN